MAHKKMVMTEAGAMHYRTRALSAGDPITLSGGDARLFAKIGWAEEPKRRTRKAPPVIADEPETEVVWTPSPLVEAAVAKKAAPRKRAAKKRNA